MCLLTFLRNLKKLNNLRYIASSINTFVLVLMMFFASTLSLFAQKKEDLEKKKNKLQSEIKYTEKLLEATKQDKTTSLNQLKKLNSKINFREDLIRTIRREITLAEEDIETKKHNIVFLQKQLADIKEEYAKIIYYAYKNRSTYDQLMFIFSAKDFNQAYRRLKYIQQYTDYRQKQADLIIETQLQLDSEIQLLQKKNEEKRNLLDVEETEKLVLAKEKSEKEEVLTELQKKEQQLLNDLKEKEKEQQQLQNAIKKIIEDEIRKAKLAAEKAGKTPAAKGMTLTPEAQELSNTFAANKGKLPWPVKEGIITEQFGEHEHAVLKGIKVNNNGIEISTSVNAEVRAVFEGEVSGIANVPGSGKVLIIRHGEYLSVYSNLKSINVKKGDKVSTKQTIGVVDTNEEKNKTEVHLEIWKGSAAMNPEFWLYKN